MKLKPGKTYLLSNGDIGVARETHSPAFVEICGRMFTTLAWEALYLVGLRVEAEVDSITFRKVPQKKLVKKGRVLYIGNSGRVEITAYPYTEKEWKEHVKSCELIRILEGVPEFPVEEVWEEV
jgi:hypothetical protein